MFSELTDGVLRTNNHSGQRDHNVCRITPHYMAGLISAERCCEIFLPPERRASANYCIGKDGEIWGSVDEENRSWCSGSSYNDNRAITIECANYDDGSLPDSTWNSLVRLCADICIRYGFRINYTGDDSGNLTMHKWYDDTDCPGPWFSNQFDRLANEINAAIDGQPAPAPHPTPAPSGMVGAYRCTVDGLRVRTAPNLNGDIVAEYNNGDIVELEDWSTSSNGYSWGRYIGHSSGCYRYVALGRDTGKVEPDDFLIKI